MSLDVRLREAVRGVREAVRQAWAEARATARDLTSGAWWRAAWARTIFRRGLGLALVVILLDQATKLWILHGLRLPERQGVSDGRLRDGHVEISSVFDLSYVENRGVSFGLFAGGMTSRIALTVLSLLVSAYVMRWLGELERRVAAAGAGFIVGGALGNVIDRVAYGYVVDFLNFDGIGFPYVFNVADAAINVGVACLIYDALVVMPRLARGEVTGPQGAGGFPQASRTAMTASEERSTGDAAGTDGDATDGRGADRVLVERGAGEPERP